MAADTAVWSGNFIPFHIRKITRSRAHLVAASGNHVACRLFAKWWEDGGNGDFDRSNVGDGGFDGIIVCPESSVLRMGLTGPLFKVDAPFHVLGSGEQIMAGALAAGANAEQAVRIALAYTDHAGGGIQVEKLDDDSEVRHLVGAPIPAEAA